MDGLIDGWMDGWMDLKIDLKIDTEVERFELVFKGFERPFTFQIIWKRIPNVRPSEGETVSVIVGSSSR